MVSARLGETEGLTSSLRSPRAWFVLLLIVVIGFAIDIGAKSWSFRTVAGQPVVLDRERLLSDPSFDPTGYQPSKPIVAGVLNFRLVLNPGAVFGIGAHQRWFFILFTVAAVLAGVVVFARYTTPRSWPAHIALGLVLAGAFGNLYDRIVFGRVRDFIHVMPGRRLPTGWTWPGTQNPELFPWVFNPADVFLFFGMIGLMLHLRSVRRAAMAAEAEAGELVSTAE